jgi:DnaJ-class molecular chaperone
MTEAAYLRHVIATGQTPDGLTLDACAKVVAEKRLQRLQQWQSACPRCGGTGRVSDDVPCDCR